MTRIQHKNLCCIYIFNSDLLVNVIYIVWWLNNMLSISSSNFYFSSPAPSDIEAPSFVEVVSDTVVSVRLQMASSRLGVISHYYLVVVPFSDTREPEAVKLDEVLF